LGVVEILKDFLSLCQEDEKSLMIFHNYTVNFHIHIGSGHLSTSSAQTQILEAP